MKLLVLAIVLGACGSKPAAPPADPAKTKTEAAGDPMVVAYDAATQWNINQTSGADTLDDKVQADLKAKAEQHLKLACDAKNECACTALKSGQCSCEPMEHCNGQPFWFLGGAD